RRFARCLGDPRRPRRRGCDARLCAIASEGGCRMKRLPSWTAGVLAGNGASAAQASAGETPAVQEVQRYVEQRAHLEANGLYRPEHERDACGVGLVAAIDGKPRRDVVTLAIAALKAVWHRGAVDADGKT